MKPNKCKSKISSAMFSSFRLLIFIIGATLAASAQTNEQQTDSPETRKIILTPAESKGAKDEILAIEKRTKRTKPIRRGGGKNTVCNVEVKNKTDYRIDIYINGRLTGSAASVSVYKSPTDIGWISVYAKTDRLFNNNFYYWGPSSFSCGNSQKDGAVFLEINPRNKK